jgi:hypothetical protein
VSSVDTKRSTTVDARQENEPEAKPYIVWVTDPKNEAQINDTRTWLEGIVKDKSKMFERKYFPSDIPEEELDKLWNEGRWDAEIESYDRLHAWSECFLDQSGYEQAKAKTEWVKVVEDYSIYRTVDYITLPRPKPKTYEVRVTDQGGAQIDETRTWCEGLVKDKSKMLVRRVLSNDIPKEEPEKFWDEGRWDDEIETYEKTTGWSGKTSGVRTACEIHTNFVHQRFRLSA